MGRNSRVAPTVENTMKISLSVLTKNGFFRQGKKRTGDVTWPNGANVRTECFSDEKEKHMRLRYSATVNGATTKHDYKIELSAIPSNLGKGEILYFICPVSKKRCRQLFLATDLQIFVSRQAFPKRLYYRLQLSSKQSKANDSFWYIEDTLKRISKRKELFAFQGKKTRYAQRVEKLQTKRARADKLRWSAVSMPMKLRRELQRMIFSKRKS